MSRMKRPEHVAAARQREQSRRLSVLYRRLIRHFEDSHPEEFRAAYFRIRQEINGEMGPLPGDFPSE